MALAYPVSEAKDKPATLHFIHIPLSCPEALQEWSKLVTVHINCYYTPLLWYVYVRVNG